MAAQASRLRRPRIQEASRRGLLAPLRVHQLVEVDGMAGRRSYNYGGRTRRAHCFRAGGVRPSGSYTPGDISG